MNDNGKIKPADSLLFPAQNRSFRYGDGLFETIKVSNVTVLLAGYHFDRLLDGIQLLGIESSEKIDRASLTEEIIDLCKRNGCSNLARVRLAAYRTDDNKAAYVIEAEPLQADANQWNENGWTILLYPHARKSCDPFANLKSANYLLYVMASRYAAANGADECLVLNSDNNICDGSKTNLFLIRDNELLTPALHQGCVSGVMRRLVIDEWEKRHGAVHQTSVNEETLLSADEVFLTNAIHGIRWVERFGEKKYKAVKTAAFYQYIFSAVYQ